MALLPTLRQEIRLLFPVEEINGPPNADMRASSSALTAIDGDPGVAMPPAVALVKVVQVEQRLTQVPRPRRQARRHPGVRYRPLPSRVQVGHDPQRRLTVYPRPVQVR
jgi:hypothetical protein